MSALVKFLGTSAAAHLAGIIGLVVLLALGVGPQAEEIGGLALLLGIALPSSTTPPSAT